MNIDNIPEGFEVVEEEKVDLVPEGFEIVKEEEDEKKKQAKAQVDANAEAVVGDSMPVGSGSALPIVENNTATTEVAEVPELEETEEIVEEVEEPKKTTKSIKENFKKDFGVNFKNIEKAIEKDVDVVEANFQEKLNTAFFSEGGVDNLLKTAENGTQYYDMDRLQQDMYNKIVDEYKVELDAVNKKYEDVNKRIDAYNVLAEEENKKAYDDYTRKQLEAKQHRLELTGVDGEPKDLYFRYDRHGNLQTIYDYTTLEDAWVTSKKISLEEFKLANPTLSNREAKKQYFMSNDSKERFDSVEDYVNAWNQTKRNGYIVKQGPGIILDEFEVVTEKPGEKIPYNDFDSRRDYYNDNISKELFKNFAEGQVVPALEEIIPDEFTISEAVAGADYVTVMHNETGEEITIGVDYNSGS